jgi:spore coat protein U-like protein
VPYQLTSTAGAGGTIWGNTATSTAVGNGVAGTGTGAAQSLTVYATAASANFTPDSYADTVTVNVNY